MRADQSRAGRQLLRGGTSGFSPCPGLPVSAGRSLSEEPAPLPCCCWLLWGGVRNAPNAPLLCRHRNEDKTMSKPCPVLLASSKKPHHPQMGPSHHHACPRPPPVAASTSVLSPTCLGPPFLFFVFFFSSPFLLPRPSLCDCATRRIVFAKPRDLSLALGSVLFLPSKREKGIAAELSPAPGPCCCRTTQRDRLRGTFGASGTICKQPSSPKTRPSQQQGGRALHRVTPRDMKTLEEPPCFPGTSQPGCSSAPARCLLPTSGQPQPLRERRRGKGCPKRGQNKEGVER